VRSDGGPRRWRWWAFAVAVMVGLVSLVAWLRVLGDADLSRADQMASVVGGYVALVSLPVAVFSLLVAISQGDQAPGAVGAGLDNAANVLAMEVGDKWMKEASFRQARPMPLKVHWSSTIRAIAADPEAVLDRSGADWRQMPLAGDAEAIVGAFGSLPHEQLVILGEAGAGKSVLAILLTLGLLEARETGRPVPVLLPIASWNPSQEKFGAFVTRRLEEEHKHLRPRDASGSSLASRLVKSRAVIPIVDGLDELPAEWHAKALESLAGIADLNWSLVVTCRSEAYERAVERSGVIMKRAAVVEIEPVAVEQVIAFLSHDDRARARWQQVLDRLREEPSGPLTTALSTPLMVTLARTAYQPGATDPRDLLTLTDHRAVTDSLLKQYVRSVYDDENRPHLEPDKTQQRRKCPPALAERWLSCLAYHASQAGTGDLAWWQISPGLLAPDPDSAARWVRRGTVLVATAAVGLIAGVLARPGQALPTSLSDGLSKGTALIAGIVALVVIGTGSASVFRSLWPGGYPPYVSLRYRSRLRRRLPHLGFGATFGTAVGLVSGPLVGDIGLGLIAGLVCGLINAVVPAWPVLKRTRQSTPRMTLNLNRRNAATAAAQHGLTAAVVFSMAALITPWTWEVPTVGATAAVVFGTAAALGAGLWTWTQFRLAHARLALIGWLPWRLFAFLEDAHRRGVLRQAGTVWQFRHALLQDHLAHLAYLRAYANDLSADRTGADESAQHGHDQDGRWIELSRARTTEQIAAWRLADQLTQGRHDEAAATLRARADTGEFHWRSASRHTEEGNAPAAIATLRLIYTASWRWDSVIGSRERSRSSWPSVGDVAERDVLGQLTMLRELRARANAGKWGAARQLADLLVERGEVDELQARADGGDQDAVERLADLHVEQGKVEKAVELLRARAEAGAEHAAVQLAELLAERGRAEEAIAILRVHGRGGLNGARMFYRLLAEHGHFDELWALAETGSWGLAEVLPVLIEMYGHIEELRAQADDGNWRAAERLACLLAEQGQFEELRARAEAGDWYAGEWLAVRDIPFPWKKDALADVMSERPIPAPDLPSGGAEPNRLPSAGPDRTPPRDDESSVLVGALKLVWRLGPSSTMPTTWWYLPSILGGAAIGAVWAHPGAVGYICTGVLIAASLAWPLPLLRTGAAAWAVVRTWRDAPSPVRSVAVKLLVLIVPVLSSAALVIPVLVSESAESPLIGLVVLLPAGILATLLALKIVSFQATRWEIRRKPPAG
jgi:hypothetical protein